MPQYDYWEDGDSRLAKLAQHKFFQDCLSKDARGGAIFPAVRSRRFDFYYQGQKLCSFNGRTFQSNIAYLAAFDPRPKGEVTEEGFQNLKVCQTFQAGYDQIKRNISNYRQPESGAVSDLCQKFSFVRDLEKVGPIVVLDVEISREAVDGGQNRPDLLLYNRDSKELRFVEVKTFGNSYIWRSPNQQHPNVVQQVQRYSEYLRSNHERILRDYTQAIGLLNELFGTDLPEPLKVDVDVDLLVVDFDRDKLKVLNKTLVPGFGGSFRCHRIGNAKSATKKTMNKWWQEKIVGRCEAGA